MLLDQAEPRFFDDGRIGLIRFDLDDGLLIAHDAAIDHLNPDEIARAARFRFDIHRRRFVQGRAVLRGVLANLEGLVQGLDAVIETEHNGKPYLVGSDLYFNLSHSDHYAVLVWSRQNQVGVDVETHDRKVDIDALAPAVFTKAEQRVLNALPAEQRCRRFFTFWTSKEARMKVTGQGMSLPPNEIALKLAQDGIPVGFDAPQTPETRLMFVDVGADLSCSIATMPSSTGAVGVHVD